MSSQSESAMPFYPIIHTHEEKSSLTNTESSRVEFSIRLYSSRKNIIPIDLMLTWAAVAILSFDVANIKSKKFVVCYCIFSGSKSFLFHSSFVLLVHSSFWVFSVWDSRLRCPLCWAGCYWKISPAGLKSMDLDIFRWNPWFHKSGYIGGLESQAWESGLHFRVVLDSKSKVSLEISNGYCPCCFGKKGKTTKSRSGPVCWRRGPSNGSEHI